MKSYSYPSFYKQLPYIDYPPPPPLPLCFFLQENLDLSPSLIFQKSQPPYK